MRTALEKEVWRLGAGAPLFLLLILSLFVSCATTPSNSEQIREVPLARLLASEPRAETPRFFGVSPRLADREEELQVALRNAAIQAARFVHLRGEAVFYTEQQSSRSGYIHSVTIDDDMELAVALSDSLLPEGVWRDDDGSYVLFALGSHQIDRIEFSPRNASGAPVWLEIVPEIPGYYVGVGSAQRSRLVTDSIEKSDKQALSALLSQLEVKIISGQGDRAVEGRGTSSSTTNLSIARGELRGFYILDRWIAADGSFFSLAICPTNQNL